MGNKIGGIELTVDFYDQEEGEVTTVSSLEWEDAYSKAPNIAKAGERIIQLSVELKGNVINKKIAWRWLIDDVEMGIDEFIPTVSGGYNKRFDQRGINLSKGQHTMEIQIMSGDVAQTATVRRIRVFVMKH